MTWLPDNRPKRADTVHTPTSLNQEIRGRVSDLRDLQVRGEVSNVRSSGGHLYFQLKDGGSTLRCTVWRSTVARLRLKMRDGQEVICRGSVDVWVRGGNYSLNVSQVEEAGTGVLWAALQRLKERLQTEGLFEPELRRPLPFLPRTVGIVTAPTGAALQDMLRILAERCPVRVLLAPARVQGEGAAETIAAAIELLDGSGLCDVIIAGRGGGSIEDLWAFNEERVVRAFAASCTPIVSAVGHESDTLLSDYAADRRAPTPTAAAEMVVPLMDELVAQLRDRRRRMAQSLSRQLGNEARHLGQLRERLGSGEALTGHRQRQLDESLRALGHAGRRATEQRQRRLAELGRRLHRAHPMHRLALRQRNLAKLHGRLLRRGEALSSRPQRRLIHLETRLQSLGQGGRLLAERRRRLERLNDTLRALSPKAALARGYGIVRDPQTGAAVVDASAVADGQGLEVLLARGALEVVVASRRPEPESPTP